MSLYYSVPCIPYHISSQRSCLRSKRLRCEVVVSSVFRGFCQTYSLRIRRLQHAHASITRTSGRRAFGSMGRLICRYTVHLDLDCLSKSMFLVQSFEDASVYKSTASEYTNCMIPSHQICHQPRCHWRPVRQSC